MLDSSLLAKLSGCICALLTAGKGHWAGGGEGGGYKNQTQKSGERKSYIMLCNDRTIINYTFIHIVIFVIKGPRPSEFWPR